MSINPEDYVIHPNNWFETTVEYRGNGIAEFESPSGHVWGLTTIDFDEAGNAECIMEIKDFDCEEYLETKFPHHDTLLWLLNGRKPHIGAFTFHLRGVNPHNKCKILTVTTQDGVFRSIGRVLYSLPMFSSKQIIFHLNNCEYHQLTEQRGRYWILPLTNFVSQQLETISFPLQHHILDQHPLRIYPTPSVPVDLPLEQQQAAIRDANRVNCFIPFEFGNELGFIERLPDYEERSKKLQQQEASLITTSLMIGSCEDKSIEFDEVFSWLPLEYLHMLSLASGSLVGAPWIEFRSESGDLVRRIHTQQWQAPYSKGHIAIDNFSHGGIGWLLSKAPLDIEPELRTAIRLIVKGGQRADYLEDQLAFLFRAADTLTKKLRTKTILSTKISIDSEHEDSIKSIVQNAGQQIRYIAENCSDSEKAEIERIAQVVSGAMNQSPKRPDEAKALVLHSQELGLKDFSVIPNIEEWMQLYNKYRNQVIHESYIPNHYPIEESYPLYRHLYDLLIRSVLKQLGYDGEYRKFIPITENRSLDWITAETTIDEIWYDP